MWTKPRFLLFLLYKRERTGFFYESDDVNLFYCTYLRRGDLLSYFVKIQLDSFTCRKRYFLCDNKHLSYSFYLSYGCKRLAVRGVYSKTERFFCGRKNDKEKE